MSTKSSSKPSEAKSTSLLIESKGEREEKPKEQEDRYVVVPDLPEVCIYDIILRLPIESLCTSRFVCKSWYQIVNRPDFINAHRQRSDVGLIFLTPIRSPKSSLFRIKFAEIKDGECTLKEYNMNCMGQIRATCDGLVLLDDPLRKGLLLVNPVTKEMMNIPMPFGTRIFTNGNPYGLAFCHASRRYKLVHFYKKHFDHRIGCEVMDIGSPSWRVVDGPNVDESAVALAGFGPPTMLAPPGGNLTYSSNKLAVAMGALHWILRIGHNDLGYTDLLLSMTLDDEKFRKIPLPITDPRLSKWVFEIDGCVGLSIAQGVHVKVWILRGLGGEGWEEMFNIVFHGVSRYTAPIFCCRVNGELVFVCGDLYVYDCCSGVMRKITMRGNERPNIGWSYFPHVNSLISWRG